MRDALNQLLMLLVRLYRHTVSPVLAFLFPGGGCRFEPTCSCYALEALQRHGPFCGSWLTVKRLARCHPWGGCGHDPVPSATQPAATPAPPLTSPASASR
jgi:uncharacterized protein